MVKTKEKIEERKSIELKYDRRYNSPNDETYKDIMEEVEMMSITGLPYVRGDYVYFIMDKYVTQVVRTNNKTKSIELSVGVTKEIQKSIEAILQQGAVI